MSGLTNADIARVFSRIAVMLELDEANPFRVRAYREAARIVEGHPESVARLAGDEGALESIAGIGKDLAQKIRDVAATGTTGIYRDLAKKYPPEVVGFTELQGLGPKRVKTLFQELHIRDRAALEAAARAGKLRELPGFGEKVEQNVLKALASASVWSGRALLGGVWGVAHDIAARVKAVRGVTHVELAGSFRRRRETVGDLDVLVTGGDADPVMEALTGHESVAEVLGKGETKSSVKLRSGLQVDLRLVPPESFGAALLYFTGSKEHNIELRKIAIDRGMSLNEYGLTRGATMVAGRTEEEIYQALGLAWIPPELREMRGEIEQARDGTLPRLIEESDIRADLHLHTDRTDGRDSLETMVRAAQDKGYAYCAITDHSQSLAMTFGFDGGRVRKSVEEMAAVRRKVPGIEILHGLEVDILAEGELDLDDESLALLDWVIVSLHSRLDQSRDVMTARVLKALEHPLVHAMGHPSSRLLLQRQPAALDWEPVFARAAELGVAMEINAQPDRLDLSDVHARQARALGVPITINTDAHQTAHFDFMRYGVFVARRAGLTKGDVLNALPVERFRAAIRPRGVARARTVTPVKRAAKKPVPPARAKQPVSAKKPAAGTMPRAAKKSAAPPRAKKAPAKARARRG